MNKGKKPITHVLLVIDMSGSMEDLAAEVRNGFNRYIEDLRADDNRYRVTVTVFDTRFISLCVAAKLKDVPPLTSSNYDPEGMTALYDAVGKTITEFEERTELAEGERVLFVVSTDGRNNASQLFRSDDIAKMLRHRKETGRWTFVYLGAGPDAWGVGAGLGFYGVDTANSAAGTRSTYTGLTVGTRSFAAGESDEAILAVVAAAAAVDKGDTGGTTH